MGDADAIRGTGRIDQADEIEVAGLLVHRHHRIAGPHRAGRDRHLADREARAAVGGIAVAEQNAVALACKEFYPDFEFMGRYDAFWTDRVQRGQVGMNMNIVIRIPSSRHRLFDCFFDIVHAFRKCLGFQAAQ